ncbi:MAG: response regulator [bacterium]|nr:response regulator [bacterium]
MATILIANPYDRERQRFRDALEDDGHTFFLCKNGEEVQAALQEVHPDLVITDVDLPGLDAFELVRLLEHRAPDKGIPLIVGHSGQQEGENLQPARDANAFTWMGFSAGPDDLRKMVRARLEIGRVNRVQGKILVVDDDLSIRQLLERQLKKEGFEVITALDGAEGLERLEEGPDLVLTDVAMPGVNGFEFLERMRSEPRYREIPVIVMTAHAEGADDAARGLDLGANDYVRKPFEWQELSARVQTHLRVREIYQLSMEKQRDLAIIELAGAAAHEINNPLAVVMTRLELMLGRMNEGDALYEELQKIDGLVARIAGVVKKMSQVRRYQVQNYCGDVNIIDLDAASSDD